MLENGERFLMNNRYSRQIKIISEEEQETLLNSTVFIAGAGGLGSPVAMYLAEAGIGTIRIADSDCVEISNLNRQILHPENRIGMLKVDSANKTISELNSSCKVIPIAEEITRNNAKSLIGNANIIIDCLDNFTSRYILNEVSQEMGIPLLHAAISGLSGQITLIIPNKTPCLSCIFPNTAPPETTIPSFGAAVGVIGSLEALEATRFLLGKETLAGKILLIDLKENKFEIFKVKQRKNCTVCNKHNNE